MITFLALCKEDPDVAIRLTRKLVEMKPDYLAVEGNPEVISRYYKKIPRVIGEVASRLKDLLGITFEVKQYDKLFTHLNRSRYGIFPWKTCQRFADAEVVPLSYLDGPESSRSEYQLMRRQYREFLSRCFDFEEQDPEQLPVFQLDAFLQQRKESSVFLTTLARGVVERSLDQELSALAESALAYLDPHRSVPRNVYRWNSLHEILQQKQEVTCVVDVAAVLDVSRHSLSHFLRAYPQKVEFV